MGRVQLQWAKGKRCGPGVCVLMAVISPLPPELVAASDFHRVQLTLHSSMLGASGDKVAIIAHIVLLRPCLWQLCLHLATMLAHPCMQNMVDTGPDIFEIMWWSARQVFSKSMLQLCSALHPHSRHTQH